MTENFIDPDVIVRYLTGDDPAKQERAARVFNDVAAGRRTPAAPDTVVADAVFVLRSQRLYAVPREEVVELLIPLVRLTHFHIENKQVVLTALQIFAAFRQLDFGDAMIVAAATHRGDGIVLSWDRDFDRVPGVSREEP